MSSFNRHYPSEAGGLAGRYRFVPRIKEGRHDGEHARGRWIDHSQSTSRLCIRWRALSFLFLALTGTGPFGQTRGMVIQAQSCLCCAANLPKSQPQTCPECHHTFRGNGWDGIDAHWRSNHSAVRSYEEFWNTLCEGHRTGTPSDI